MGRKNWLFCWTEVGAEQVGVIQSLIVTSQLQGIDPKTYLVDVLQRVAVHPASKVEEQTLRVWKTKFIDSPMTSMLDAADEVQREH
jgi:transposase